MKDILDDGICNADFSLCARAGDSRAVTAIPRILLFDEATFTLDNITQKTVVESLQSLKCTCIVIAYRLSTIR